MEVRDTIIGLIRFDSTSFHLQAEEAPKERPGPKFIHGASSLEMISLDPVQKRGRHIPMYVVIVMVVVTLMVGILIGVFLGRMV
jgi:hypothetical protein